MTSLQIINKIINTKSASLLDDEYGINDVSFFKDYEDEYNFIVNHIDRYGNVPDINTFINNFPDFMQLEVNESNLYLSDALKNEKITNELAPLMNEAIELINQDKSADAIQILKNKLDNIETYAAFDAVDIFESAENRLNRIKDMADDPHKHFITTGFPELDNIIGGFQRGEELVLYYARLGNGKSSTLINSLNAAHLAGERVGIISPEMQEDKIGYKVDTLRTHISNSALVRGSESLIDMDLYEEYINHSKNINGFYVSTPQHFNNIITVSKLRKYIKQYSLTILAIDGIMYLTDERASRGDTTTLALTHIAQDLKSLSDEMNIPILIVHQSNRGGAKSKDDAEDMPNIINVSHSDGIAQCCTKVIALRQMDHDKIIMEIQKNRDDKSGQRLTYLWDADKGYYKSIAVNGTDVDESFVKMTSNKFSNDNVF